MGNKNDLSQKLMEAAKAEYGEDFVLEEGDNIVFELNDCTLILRYEEGKVTYEFIGNKPIKVDFSTGFYTAEESGGVV